VVVLLACSSQARNQSFVQGTLRAHELKGLYGEHTAPACTRYLTSLVRHLAGADAYDLSVRLLATHEPLAVAPGNNEILISAGLIKNLNSEAEAAFMLTHEAGHVVLQHQLHLVASAPLLDASRRRTIELEADRFALDKLNDAGYNTAAALSALDRVYRLSPDFESSQDYPTLQERIKHLSSRVLSTSNYSRGIEDRREFQRCRRSLQ
jgi:predicted Zn-dependent protease